jgi:hypothetical protein
VILGILPFADLPLPLTEMTEINKTQNQLYSYKRNFKHTLMKAKVSKTHQN